MRGVLIAEKINKKKEYIDIFFDAYWKNDLNLNDEDLIYKLFRKIGLNEIKFENEIKDELKNKTQEAFEKGIFGAPSFIVNNKIFFGQDRVEFVLKEAGK